MRSGWTTLRDSVPSSPTPTPTLLEWPFQGQQGSGLTASGLVSDVSVPAGTNGVWPSAACECGAKEQTADHVVLQCPIHRPCHGEHSLMVLDVETIEWLLTVLDVETIESE